MTSNTINFSSVQGANELNPKYVKFSWSGTWNNSNRCWTITWNATAQGGYNSTAYVQTQNGSITIAAVVGTAAGAGTTSMSAAIPQTHNDDVILSGSFTLTPNAAGSASFSVAGSVDFWTTATYGFKSSSITETTQTLDAVSTASTIILDQEEYIIRRLADNVVSSITFSVKSTGDYYHEIVYYTSSVSTPVTIVSADRINNTTKGYTISGEGVLERLADTANGAVAIQLKTYSDSSKAHKVGQTQTVFCSVTIQTTQFKPIITAYPITATSTPISGCLIAGHSRASMQISATGRYGTDIKSIAYSIAPGSFAKTTGSISGSSGGIQSNNLPSSTADYTLTISVTVTDGRGQTETASATATVYGYIAPKITTNIYRVASSSSTTRDDAGEYVRISFSAAVQSTVNGNNTIQSTTCTASGSISGNQTNNTWKALSADGSAKFVVTAADKVTSVSTTVNIDAAKFALELYDDKQGTLWAQSGGYFRSLKSGDNDGAGVQVRTVTGSASVSVKRTDTGNDVQLMVGGGGSNIGLYSENLNNWILYHDSDDLTHLTHDVRAEKSILGTNNASLGGNTRIQIVPKMTSTALNAGTSWEDYTVAWMKKVVELYPNLSETLFIGNVIVNSRAIAFWYSYDNSDKSRGLPKYSFGHMMRYKSAAYGNILGDCFFGTNDYISYYNASVPINSLDGTLNVSKGGTGVTGSVGAAYRPVYMSSSGLAACSAMTSLYSGSLTTGSVTLTDGWINYNYLIILGTPSTGSPKSSVTIPNNLLTTSDQAFGFSNETFGVSFNLKRSGNDVVLTYSLSSSGTGAITNVYGGI